MYEVNFDAIVGPTHNYAGLAYGNIAAEKNKQSVSNPREAALEGLAKMKFLAALGVKQAVLPPPLRPDVGVLRALGYGGSDEEVLAAVLRDDPALLAAAGSASAMWAANAATVSPAIDSGDGRVHFSPANMLSQFHRSIEAAGTAAVLRGIFGDPAHFFHHPPLPAHARWSDEGAANHTRLGGAGDGPGLQIFVYGRKYLDLSAPVPKKFPARQTFEACRALARRHQLAAERTVFIQQNPEAIDAGVFHNDVAAVGHENVFLCHAQAYADQRGALEEIRAKFAGVSAGPLHLMEISADELSLEEAVQTYLFNSQIVTLQDGAMSLIAPAECETQVRARAVIDRILSAGTPIRSVQFLNVRQSMRNGGGPACLRLRVLLTEAELAAAHGGVFLDDVLYKRVVRWVNQHYRQELRPIDLGDVKLLEEARAALSELSQILHLPLGNRLRNGYD